MKIKNFNKKLSLNKQTVASLHNEELNRMRGGAASGVYQCYTYPTYCTACYTDDEAWCENISAFTCTDCETR